MLRSANLLDTAVLFFVGCIGCAQIQDSFSHREVSDGDIARLYARVVRANSTLTMNEHYTVQRIYCQDGMAVSFEFDPFERSDSHIRYRVCRCNREGFSWECDAPGQVTKVLVPEFPKGVRVSNDLELEDAKAVISRWSLLKKADIPASVSLYSPELAKEIDGITEEIDGIFDSSLAHETTDCTHTVVTENGDFYCIDLQCSVCSFIHFFGPMSTNLRCWPLSD